MKITYKLPASYSQVTIGQLSAWMTAKNDVGKVAAATGEDEKTVRGWPVVIYDTVIQQFTDIIAGEQQAFKQTFTVSIPDAPIFKRRVMVGFIPDLHKISMDEFADLITYCDKAQYYANLHKIMAVLYRPISYKVGKKYRLIKYDPTKSAELHEAMSRIPAMYLNGALAFFLNLQNELATSSQQSFRQKMTSTLRELTEELRKK